MATITSRKMKLQFNVTPSATSTSSKRTWTFSSIADDDSLETSDIEALAAGFITNSAIFDTPPLSVIKVEIEETTTEQVIPAA